MVALEQAEVFLLDQEQSEHYWDDISDSLDCDTEIWSNWFTKEGILERLRDQTMQAWVVCEKHGPIKAVLLSQILVGELGKVLNVFWIRGELPEGALKCLSLTFDSFGAHHGCYMLFMTGRKGWERLLRGFGAEVESVSMSRAINKPVRN